MVIVVASYPDKKFFRSGNDIKTRKSYSRWGTYGVIIQKRRSNRDDLGIISHISLMKHILWPIIRTIMRGHNISFC